LYVQEVGEDSKKKEGSMAGPSPLWLGDELEFWPEKASGVPMRYTLLNRLPQFGVSAQQIFGSLLLRKV
jgi:hypothetical protein